MKYLTVEQILFLHARLLTETGGSQGLRDLSMLLSAVAGPQASFDDQYLYPDLFAKAAALLDLLVRNHPFADGNKRTGIVGAALFLKRNGYRLIASDIDLVEFTLQVAQSRLPFEQIVVWLQINTQPIED